MKRQAVASTMIQSMGWENGVLEVQFVDGSIFIYSKVPQDIYRRITKAQSVGKRFGSLVRNEYPFKQVKGRKK